MFNWSDVHEHEMDIKQEILNKEKMAIIKGTKPANMKDSLAGYTSKELGIMYGMGKQSFEKWEDMMDTIPSNMANPLEGLSPKALGAKHDQGKLLFGCLTQGLAPVLKGVAAILTFGAKKYSRDSWQDVPNGKQRYHDAMERHLNAYNSGENFDKESGLHHMLHMICCAMFVMWFEMQKYPNADYTKFNKPGE